MATSPSQSPPISPFTYNASEDDGIYTCDSPVSLDEKDAHNKNISSSNRHQVVSQELSYIQDMTVTPKAGSKRHQSEAPTPKVDNIKKKPNHTYKKMHNSSSSEGVLTGERNTRADNRPVYDDASKSRVLRSSDASVTSSTSVWHYLYRQRPAADKYGNEKVVDEVKRNDTPGTSTEEDEDASLRELEENDAFAMEVGLMFSTDDGDTIANADLYSQGLPNILTMDSLDTSTVNEHNLTRNPSSDLSAYLNSNRHNIFLPNNLSLDTDNKNDIDSGYIQHPKYAFDQNVQQQFFNDDASKDTLSTARDDHGNKLPPNGRAILRFKNKQSHVTTNNQNVNSQASYVYPPIPITQSFTNQTYQSREEMEKRLRDLAGQLNHDWRTGPTTFIASPALARRLRDFQFAREKRRKKYGVMKLWGILGLYDHLSGVKIDVEWAEDAAWRRLNCKPYLTWGDYEIAKNEGYNRPFFTYFVVSMCTAMMFAAWFVNGWEFEPISVNPMIGPSADTLLRLGAKDSYSIVHEQEIWRLVSPMVLHAGLIHYILNMFALWYVGKAIEVIHGHFQAASAFIVPAIGGIILSAIFLPQYITVGASGGIFGLIGACISDIVMNWNLLFNEFVNERGARMSHARVLIVLLIDIILNCILGLTPFVDNFTHLGGMIYGFLCGLSTIQMISLRFFGDERRCAHKAKLFCFRFFGLLISMAGIITSSIFLFSGDGLTNPCPSCTIMSCIPFPPWTAANEKWWYCDDCSQATAEGTLNTATGQFVEMDLTCPDESVINVKVDETWPKDELGLEAMLPMICRERC